MSTQQTACLEETHLSELFKTGHNPPDDRSWLEAFASMCRSQSTFILAEFAADKHLVERAGDLVVYRNGHFVSVRQLVDACASHNWNRLLYEAWAWETAQRVQALLRCFDVSSARAVRLYAEHLGYYQIDTGAMQEVICEARLATGDIDY